MNPKLGNHIVAALKTIQIINKTIITRRSQKNTYTVKPKTRARNTICAKFESKNIPEYYLSQGGVAENAKDGVSGSPTLLWMKRRSLDGG